MRFTNTLLCLSAIASGCVSTSRYEELNKSRATNRRIDVVLLPDLSTLPGFDELQHAVSQQ